MKKFLLSCFLALGISSSAQYTYTGDFENPGYNTTIYKQFGGGSQTAGAACQGGFGGQLLTTASLSQTGFMIDLSTIGQTSNGQRVDFRVSYKKAAGVAGTLYPAYFVFNSATNQWSINYVGTPVTLTTAELTTCSTLIAAVPTGAIQPGAIVGIGAWFVRSGTANAGIFLDDILITQDNTVTTAPACTTITAPVAGSTISAGTGKITWDAVPTAVNYKVKVGTTPGGSELFAGTVAGTSLNVSLAKSTLYYASVVPSNAIGDAQSCGEISFTTNTTIAYCGGITASSTVYPLSSVTLNGVTNTSSAATGAPAYEDFTSTVFNVVTGTSYNLTAIGTGLGTNVFAMAAFIDWNEDGDFNDANEKYFQNAPFVSGSGNPINLSGSIAVPSGVTPGTKRMRVKYNFQGGGAVLQPTLTDPCANMTNGQTEDYSVSVTVASVAPVCTTFTAPTNLSTNFPANGLMTWAPAATATGYKLFVGTTPNGTDILNGVTVNGTSYQVSLTAGTMYYAKVVPFNTIGEAQSCTEISFTAAAAVYCTAGATSTSFEKISNVTLGTVINNPSTSTAGYEDFTALSAAPVNRNSSYGVAVTISGFDSDETYVWIDYNQDGNFDDATEKVTLAPAATSTGTITIPNTAKLGNTRMRVRLNYPLIGGNNTACGTSTYGQVEDYTLEIKETLATAAVTKSTVAVYPNPFQDVLNISDVKGVKSISISDMSGRQVKVMAPSATLQVSDLKTGLYIVNLNMEDGSVRSIKAIKK
ncbi:GEVED domain-containing protein [Chryseobacterium sp. MP_3.2]|uniref:GEVED domain-containing protein n=1 Tax=Chryseobacterium sp. MP_3.2 TaxID=3071712 RepID=UPI002DFE2440|nr:hypothetical protein [Chryseobacterium sp. MP_3.2]